MCVCMCMCVVLNEKVVGKLLLIFHKRGEEGATFKRVILVSPEEETSQPSEG